MTAMSRKDWMSREEAAQEAADRWAMAARSHEEAAKHDRWSKSAMVAMEARDHEARCRSAAAHAREMACDVR